MPLWDYIHVGRQNQQEHHNLQDGLFQIATQTCSILVQVNNTNNISYGENATNVQYNNFASDASASCSSSTTNNRCSGQSRGSTRFDREQSIILIPPLAKAHHDLPSQVGGQASSRRHFFQHYKHRLSVRIPLSILM